MSWRDLLQVREPDAEEKLFIELQNRKLLRRRFPSRIMPMNTVVRFLEDGIELCNADKFTVAMAAECDFTIPDRLVVRYTARGNIEQVYPFYLDGPPHKRNGVRERDERINRELEIRGITPQRYPYVPVISEKLLMKIADDIEALMQ